MRHNWAVNTGSKVISGHIKGQNQVTGLTAPSATGPVMVRWCLRCGEGAGELCHMGHLEGISSALDSRKENNVKKRENLTVFRKTVFYITS